MKTIIFILLMSLFAANQTSYAIKHDWISLADEMYVNDIPFDTHAIFNDSAENKELKMKLQDESCVDDILFDTFVIFERNVAPIHSKFKTLPDEEYIDDIPFDTSVVATNMKLSGMVTM